jgi:dTDP-4-amino-4,6-dideoxygalactose transaminase
MKNKIWLSSPHMSGEEIKYVNEAFDTNWIAPLGPNVNGFEEDLSSYCGAKYSAALISGTSAIHLALIILGIKYGDEVICQSLTFSGSANPINYVGASPIFIDSEKESWNMDPVILEVAIKDRLKKGIKPKAIIFVHLYGMPAQVQQIKDISIKYHIPLIEDSAEALGSIYFGRKCGSFTDFGILSFNGNKIITTSGGGALLSNKKEIIDKTKYLSTQARDEAPHYQHSEVGYNYRMSNVVAGIGRGQLKVLDLRVKQKREIFDWYKNVFGGIEGIEFQPEMEGSYSNRWLTAITIDPEKTGGITREYLRQALLKDNIEARPLWKPMHLQPVFEGSAYYANGVSENLFEDGICLPSGTNMSEEDEERIERAIKKVFKR